MCYLFGTCSAHAQNLEKQCVLDNHFMFWCKTDLLGLQSANTLQPGQKKQCCKRCFSFTPTKEVWDENIDVILRICGSHQAITTKLKPLNTHSSNLITCIVLEVSGETGLHSEHCTWAFLRIDFKQFYVLALIFTRGHVWHLHYTVTKRQLLSTYAFWLNVRNIYTENGNWLEVNYRRPKFIFGSQNDDQLLFPSHWQLSINQSHVSWEKAG